MNNLILLYRKPFGDEYVSADSLFDGKYNIYELLDMFPEAYLLLVNDTTEYNLEQVINRTRLNQYFKVDDKNEMPCVNCKAGNPVDREYCYKCGYKNKYYSVTKFLSDSFSKAMSTKYYVLYEFWEDQRHRSII